MSELPLGWTETTLGETCEIVSGSTPSTKESTYWGGDVPWITPDDLSRHAEKVIYAGARSITKTGYEACSTRLVPTGTVLFTSRAPIGYVAIAGQPVCTNQGFKSFVPPQGLSSDYLYWFLRYATPEIRKLGSGTTFPELSKTVAGQIEIPVAPLAEQRRIVAAIEEKFSRLDAAEESLRQAQRSVARLRAAAVADALSGNWPITSLRDLTAEQTYGSSAKAMEDPRGVPILRMGNIQDGSLNFGNLKYLPRAHPDAEKLRLKPGDLLFNRTNSPELVGKSAVFKTGPDPIVFASYLIRVRLTPDCDPDWAALAINGPEGRRYVASVRTQQVGQANVNGTKLAAMPIPLPPLEEQRRIVAEVEHQLSLVDALAAGVDSALRRSAALRRAILARAFRGELVPQDPDDEPASVLLERIAAGRAAVGSRAKQRRAVASADPGVTIAQRNKVST